jgi:hypothetical protein
VSFILRYKKIENEPTITDKAGSNPDERERTVVNFCKLYRYFNL